MLACPCCLNLTMESRGDYAICPVCFWEDDGSDRMAEWSPVNDMSLAEARANYQRIGACCKAMLPNVRPATEEEWPIV